MGGHGLISAAGLVCDSYEDWLAGFAINLGKGEPSLS